MLLLFAFLKKVSGFFGCFILKFLFSPYRKRAESDSRKSSIANSKEVPSHHPTDPVELRRLNFQTPGKKHDSSCPEHGVSWKFYSANDIAMRGDCITLFQTVVYLPSLLLLRLSKTYVLKGNYILCENLRWDRKRKKIIISLQILENLKS